MTRDLDPKIPDSLGNVFLKVSREKWYVRWKGQGAFVGSADGRKQGALIGLDLLEKLLPLSNWEGSPTQLLGLIHGPHSGTSFQEGMAIVGVEGSDEGRANTGFEITTFCDPDIAREVLRHIQSAESLIAQALPTLGKYLKATVLPPTKWDGTWMRRDPDSQWTCGHIHDYVPPEHDSSNVFRRDSPDEWQILFGDHECRVPHSDGVEMLSILLLHPDRMMGPDELYSEIGHLQAALCEEEKQEQEEQRELGELMKLAQEFSPELREDWVDIDEEGLRDLPNTAESLADALVPIAQRLAQSAKDSFVEARLRSRGIQYAAGRTPQGSFDELKAKKERCEAVIAGLRKWEANVETALMKAAQRHEDSTLGAQANKALRGAISEIRARNSVIGSYMRKNFNSVRNICFYMDIGTHWRVSNDPEPGLFHRSAPKNGGIGDT